MSDKPELLVAPCSYQAAKYAVEKWHYSGRMPAGLNTYYGVWEGGEYIGAVVYGLGSGNATNGTRYGLASSHEMAELVRVALRSHVSPVSKIVGQTIKMLQKNSPGLRLLISMADPLRGHVGSIYQAMNWVYTGTTKPDVLYFSRGKWVHHRTATSRGSAAGLPAKHLPPKHRYLYPLDRAMRKQIAPLAQPYPKRDTRPVNGDDLATSEAGRFDSEPGALIEAEPHGD